MARPVTTRDDRYMRELESELDKRAQAAAAELGPGADSVRLSDADKVARWNFQLGDEAAMALLDWAQAVVEGGQQIPPPDVGHPFPERVAEWYSRGGGREAAATARWPLRQDLWQRGNVAVEDQVREAGRLSRLAARHAQQEGGSNG